MAFNPNAGMYPPDQVQRPQGFNYGQFLSSPGGAALINGVGGGLAAYGQHQDNQQNLQQNALQFAASTRQNQYNADRQLAAQRAGGVLNADPLGADQAYAQHNALLSAILPKGFSPARSGDANVISGRGGNQSVSFDPAMVNAMFGNDATMASIAKHNNELSNLDPNAPTTNFASMYGNDPNAAKYQSQVSDWAQRMQTMDANEKAAFEKQMSSYVDQMVQQEQQQGNSSGFWHKFAKIAGIVGAAAATYFTAGAASPLLVAALGAGSAAATAWGNGGSGGDALQSAVLGGGTSYVGARAAQRG